MTKRTRQELLEELDEIAKERATCVALDELRIDPMKYPIKYLDYIAGEIEQELRDREAEWAAETPDPLA